MHFHRTIILGGFFCYVFDVTLPDCTIYSSVLIVAKKTFLTIHTQTEISTNNFWSSRSDDKMICLHSALFKIAIVTIFHFPSHALDFNLPICHTIKSSRSFYFFVTMVKQISS